MKFLGLRRTFLGVDVIFEGKMLVRDAGGQQLETISQKRPAKLTITPIGGQGYMFARGNQQITPRLIRTT